MKIITDCAADLSPEEIQELGIIVAPLFINFPNEEVNALEITPDDFYDRLEAMQPDIPTTAQPSAGMFADMFREVVENGEEALVIHLSSGLSGTIDSARLGAKQLGGNLVTIVDSLTLSGGLRFQVLAAARAAKENWKIPDILKLLDTIRQKTEVVYTLDTLTYLARGGRIGRVQALAGSLLNLKPIIHVDRSDGKYTTVGKVRTIKRALGRIVDHVAGLYPSDEPLWVSVMHGKFLSQAEVLAKMVEERLNVTKSEILRISPVLGVHTGPGIVGVAVLPMRLMEGIA
ncbi:MAG: DegV family protein [Anaerolineales bacterium]|nr:DegV family protein [Anaerolineales bacterium]